VAANTNGVAAGSHDNHDVLNKKSEISDVNIMFESEPRVTERGSPSLVGRGIANSRTSSFETYLKTQNRRNIRQILCYVRNYAIILETGDASVLTTLSSAKRRHIMEALSAYSKHIGNYPRWQSIYKSYSLKWAPDNASLFAMQRFFNGENNLEAMLSKLKEMMTLLPLLSPK
jgi:hypothetical protein